MQDHDLAKIFEGKDLQDALRLAERIMNHQAPDDPRPLINVLTHHVALGVFVERFRNKRRTAGAKLKWDVKAKLRLWVEVEQLMLKVKSASRACQIIGEKPERWQEYPLRDKAAQTNKQRVEALYKQYMEAKKEVLKLAEGGPPQQLAWGLLMNK